MNLEALKELAAKVEAGDKWASLYEGSPDSLGLCTLIKTAISSDSWEFVESVTRAYRGSLDAAKALHDAVLPEWVFDINRKSVKLIHAELPPVYGQRFSKNLARLWLFAILRALVAQEESQ